MKAKYFISCLVLLASLFISAGKPQAVLIDFEAVPGGGTPYDQLAVSDQYAAVLNGGVTFSLDNGGTPYLEAAGDTDLGNGFMRFIGGGYDQARDDYEGGLGLGNYFLRFGTGGIMGAPSPQLIITYTAPVSGASAQIWDIDAASFGYEQWRVTSWDSNNNVINFIDSPQGSTLEEDSLDGLPWTWSFDHETADIYKISLEYVGTKPTGIGLSFDNFNTSQPVAPEPVSSILFLTGGAALGLKRLYKRKRAA